jgi:type VI secretion system protein VasD
MNIILKKNRFLSYISLVMILFFLTSCSLFETSKRPIKLDIDLSLADAVNLDGIGRASPTQVWIFELKSVKTFNSGDYFALTSADGKTPMDADVVARDEFILRPSDIKSINRNINPETKYIGVIVGYRDLPNSVWRTSIQLAYDKDPDKKRFTRRVEFDINISGNKVFIAETKKSRYSFF